MYKIYSFHTMSLSISLLFQKEKQIVLNDRKIVSQQVHIESIIGLAKTYKILTTPMSNTESALPTQIITICFLLCNFRTGIVPRDA